MERDKYLGNPSFYEVMEMEKIEIGTEDGRIYEGRRFELRIGKMIIGFDVSRRVK